MKPDLVVGSFSKIRFIVNPRAGLRPTKVEKVIQEVLDTGSARFEIVETEVPGHGTFLAREAVDQGFDLVVAVGGDGTFHEVGLGLMDCEAVLGHLPCGSGNGLARYLKIPLDSAEACRCLLDPDVLIMDAGRIGETVFFATAGIGLDAEVCWKYNRREGGRRGFLPYLIITLNEYRSFESESVRVILDEGDDFRCCPLLLTVANTSQFGSGATVAPGARPNDGLLDLCVVESPGILKLLWHARRVFTGTIGAMPGVRFYQTRGVRFERPEAGRIQVDGEALSGKATLDIKVIPGALKVAIPKGLNADFPFSP